MELAFRITGARPLGGLPPAMLVECELDASSPIAFAIHMKGRDLDDPAAGRSPKALVFADRLAARQFVARFAETFGASPPSATANERPLALEFETCLVARAGDVAHDRWNATDEAELDCDYSLAQRRGTFVVRNEEALEPLMVALSEALL